MDIHQDFKDRGAQDLPIKEKLEQYEQNLIPLYSGITILFEIRKNFGLEAMLEYMEKFLKLIDRHNPQLRSAVLKAMDSHHSWPHKSNL